MKIAIATEDKDPAAEISDHGARAMFFLVFDADGKLSEIVENPYAGEAHHVGPDVAEMLHRLQVTKVVAGRFGTKFAEELTLHHIECVERTGVAVAVANALLTL